MRKLVVYGKVEEGKGKITELVKMNAYFSNLPEGTQFELVIAPIKDFRSLKLNRTYWMYMTMIGDELGYTKHEMHEYFKRKFLSETLEIGNELIFTSKSTADLTTKEFCEYLESIFYMCSSQFNIILPDIQEIKNMKYEDNKTRKGTS